MEKPPIPVRDVMTPDPTAMRPEAKVAEALTEMKLGSIRHLPIVDQEERLIGLVTQRDLIAATDDLERPLRAIMRTDVKTVSPETPAHEAAYLLLRFVIGCVPVTEGRRLVGIVTESDFVGVAYRALGGRVPLDQLLREDEED